MDFEFRNPDPIFSWVPAFLRDPSKLLNNSTTNELSNVQLK